MAGSTNFGPPAYVEGIEVTSISVGGAGCAGDRTRGMARQIAAIDEAILGYTPDRVWAVLADVGRYHEWCAPEYLWRRSKTNTASARA